MTDDDFMFFSWLQKRRRGHDPQLNRYIHRVGMAVRAHIKSLRQLQCLLGDDGDISDLAADLGHFVANDAEEARKTVEYRRRFYASRAEYIGKEIRTAGPEIRERLARLARDA